MAVLDHLAPQQALGLRSTSRDFRQICDTALPDAFASARLRWLREGDCVVARGKLRSFFSRARALDARDDFLLAIRPGPYPRPTKWACYADARRNRTAMAVGMAANLRALSVDLLSLAKIFSREGVAPNLQRLCVSLGAAWETHLEPTAWALLPGELYISKNVQEVALTFYDVHSANPPYAEAYAYLARQLHGHAIKAATLCLPGGCDDAFLEAHEGLIPLFPFGALERLALQLAPSQVERPASRPRGSTNFYAELFARCSAKLQVLALESPNHADCVGYFDGFDRAVAQHAWPRLHTLYIAGSTLRVEPSFALADAKRFPSLRTVVLPNAVANTEVLAAFGKAQHAHLRHLVLSAILPDLRPRHGDAVHNELVFAAMMARMTRWSVASGKTAVRAARPAQWGLHRLQLFAFEQRFRTPAEAHRPASFANVHANALVRALRPDPNLWPAEE